MKSLLCFFTLLFLMSGCTWTHYTRHSKFYYRKMTEEFADKDITLIKKDGSRIQSRHFEVQLDSTYWTESGSSQKKAIPTSEILKFEARNRPEGRLKRSGKGLAQGVLFGAFGGLIMMGTISHEEEGLGVYPTYGALYGGIGGGLFGFFHELFGGTIHEYILSVPARNLQNQNTEAPVSFLRQ